MSFIKSRTIIAKTLYSNADFSGEKELLIERYIRFNNLRSSWNNNKKLLNLKFTQNGERTFLEDSLVNEFYRTILKNNLVVDKPDKDQDVIMVSMTTVDQFFSKAFNEQLIKNLTDFYTDVQTRKAQENLNILQHQVDSIQKLLNIALLGAAYTMEANPNPNPAFQTIKVPSQKKLVDVEMNKAILEELVKQLELAKISLRRETPLIQPIDEPVLPLEKKDLSPLKGILLGGFLGFIFSLLYLSFAYIIKDSPIA